MRSFWKRVKHWWSGKDPGVDVSIGDIVGTVLACQHEGKRKWWRGRVLDISLDRSYVRVSAVCPCLNHKCREEYILTLSVDSIVVWQKAAPNLLSQAGESDLFEAVKTLRDAIGSTKETIDLLWEIKLFIEGKES